MSVDVLALKFLCPNFERRLLFLDAALVPQPIVGIFIHTAVVALLELHEGVQYIAQPRHILQQ